MILTFHLINISIHRNLYQNWFINVSSRNKKAKIPESQSIFVKCKKTNALNRFKILPI